jgi:elongation factor Ts
MAEIEASQVVKLRQVTGQGMMDCKKALAESGGDMDKAVEILRKKGLATLAKRAERETKEGLVVSRISTDGKTAALASLCCETDFVSRSDDFVKAAETLAECALACPADEGVDNLLATAVGGKKFGDILTEIVSKTGEKTQVGDFAKYKLTGPGLIQIYVHFNKKVGTMVEIDTDNDATAKTDSVKRVASDIAMHITATKPLSLDEKGISAETVEQEKSIAAAQIKGKPANIVEKIVEGKMKKFFAENCLLLQPFVKDNTKTVQQVLADSAKAASGQACVKRFVRFEVG